MEWTEQLQALCLAPGVGGMTDAASLAETFLRDDCVRVERDAVGNVIGWREGPKDAPVVLLEAHLDQVGFVVTGVDEHGFLRVAACGGVDNRVLTAAEVTVYGDRAYSGVFCSVPPHLGGGELPELTDRAIDVGMTAEEVKTHIPPGSFVAYRPSFERMLGHRVTATSLDDRAGVAAILRCLSLLRGCALPVRVAVLFSVQEELGMRGAIPAAYAIDPAVAISVDVSFASMPLEDASITARLGGGPLVGFAPSLDRTFSKRLVALAEDQGLPYQYEGMGGTTGTNADKIGLSRCGVKTALLSIPLKYMHTPVEMADMEDMDHTARLMATFLQKWGQEVC